MRQCTCQVIARSGVINARSLGIGNQIIEAIDPRRILRRARRDKIGGEEREEHRCQTTDEHGDYRGEVVRREVDRRKIRRE